MGNLASFREPPFVKVEMAGLGRADVIHLSPTELSRKLKDVGLPKTLTDVLEAKEIKGSTLLMFCPEDIKYELEELSIEDRVHLRNFIREIRKSGDLEVTGSFPSRTLRSPAASSASSRSSTPNTVYLRSSDSEDSPDISLADRSSDEFSDSPKSDSNHQMYMKLPKIGTYKPLDLPSGFALPTRFGNKVDKMLKECKSPGSIPQDVQRAFVKQVTDHLESENSRPSSKTVEWVAWKYCSLYPGLRQVNPLQSLVKGDELPLPVGNFKEWGLLTEKVRRALENRRYQEKRKSATLVQPQVKKKKSSEASSEDSPGIDDSSSLERHSQRLQQELKKQMPDLEVMNQLMDSEFPRRRIFIKQLDARTRVRETLAVYPILNKGNQIEEELVRILRYERKLSMTVDGLINTYKDQYEKLKGFLSQRFSLRRDEITDETVLENIALIFPTKVKKQGNSQSQTPFVVDADEESQGDLPSKNDPYILMHRDKDDQDKLVFTIMIRDSPHCSVDNKEDSLGHAIIQLLAMYYIFHFEYPPAFRNVYFFLQQFILGDTDLPSNMPRIVNSYHAAIQQFLVFVNSQK